MRLFFHSVSQNEAIIEVTFHKNDNEFERFEFTIPSGSRNSNVVTTYHLEYYYTIVENLDMQIP